jgi:hypothetical protein
LRRVLRGLLRREQFLQLARLVHLAQDVRTADELAVDVGWRIAGQFANSLIPWRISGSSSTFTLKKSFTPQAYRICTAVAEKPHCGNCGVPFM